MTTLDTHRLIHTCNGKGFVHDNIAAGLKALETISQQENWTCVVTDNPACFSTEALARVACVVFANTHNDVVQQSNYRETSLRMEQACHLYTHHT